MVTILVVVGGALGVVEELIVVVVGSGRHGVG
jgi:hypothetical protein